METLGFRIEQERPVRHNENSQSYDEMAAMLLRLAKSSRFVPLQVSAIRALGLLVRVNGLVQRPQVMALLQLLLMENSSPSVRRAALNGLAVIALADPDAGNNGKRAQLLETLVKFLNAPISRESRSLRDYAINVLRFVYRGAPAQPQIENILSEPRPLDVWNVRWAPLRWFFRRVLATDADSIRQSVLFLATKETQDNTNLLTDLNRPLEPSDESVMAVSADIFYYGRDLTPVEDGHVVKKLNERLVIDTVLGYQLGFDVEIPWVDPDRNRSSLRKTEVLPVHPTNVPLVIAGTPDQLVEIEAVLSAHALKEEQQQSISATPVISVADFPTTPVLLDVLSKMNAIETAIRAALRESRWRADPPPGQEQQVQQGPPVEINFSDVPDNVFGPDKAAGLKLLAARISAETKIAATVDVTREENIFTMKIDARHARQDRDSLRALAIDGIRQLSRFTRLHVDWATLAPSLLPLGFVPISHGGAVALHSSVGSWIGLIFMIAMASYGLAQMNNDAKLKATTLAAFHKNWAPTLRWPRAVQKMTPELDRALAQYLARPTQQFFPVLVDLQSLLASFSEAERKSLFNETTQFLERNLKLTPGEPISSMLDAYAPFKKEPADRRIQLFFEWIEGRTFFETVGSNGVVELGFTRPLQTKIRKGEVVQLRLYRRVGRYYLDLLPLLPTTGGAASSDEKFDWVAKLDDKGHVVKWEFRTAERALSISIDILKDHLIALLNDYSKLGDKVTMDMLRNIKQQLDRAQFAYLAHLPSEMMGSVNKLKDMLEERHIHLEFRTAEVLSERLDDVRAHPQDGVRVRDLCREPFLLTARELSSMLSLPGWIASSILVEAQFSVKDGHLVVSCQRVGSKEEPLPQRYSLESTLRATFDVDSVSHSLLSALDQYSNPGDLATEEMLKNIETLLDRARSISLSHLSPETRASMQKLSEELAARHLQLMFRKQSDLEERVENIRKDPNKHALLLQLCEGPFLTRANALDSLLSLSDRTSSQPLSSHVLIEAQFSLDANHQVFVLFRPVGSKEESLEQRYALTPALRPKLYVDTLGDNLIALLDKHGQLDDSQTVESLNAIEAGLARVRAVSLADLPSGNVESLRKLKEELSARHMPLEFRSEAVLAHLVEKIRMHSADDLLLSELCREQEPFLLRGEDLNALLALSGQATPALLSPDVLVAAQFSLKPGRPLEVSFRRVGIKKTSHWERCLLTPALAPAGYRCLGTSSHRVA